MKLGSEVFREIFRVQLLSVFAVGKGALYFLSLSGVHQGYAILIREELAAQNKNKQNRDTISRQFS